MYEHGQGEQGLLPPTMPPSLSLERPAKRSRPLPAEAAAAAAGEGPDAAASGGAGACRDGPAGSRQPLLQKQPPQLQASQQQQQLSQQQPTKSPQPAPRPQPPSQSQSQPQPQPQSQSQTQPEQPQSQPQSQQARQSQQPQQQPQLQGSVLRGASGAVAVLPTSMPQWAEEELHGVDPFWQPKETLAVVTTQQAGPAPGTHGQLQSSSALFTVSPAALASIAEKKAQARLVCVQPGDGPPRRCHWYGGSYVLLNGRPYDVTKEDRVQLLLGPNQADQAVDLSSGLVRGANRLTLLWPVGVAGAVAALRLCEPRSAADLRRHLAPPLPQARAADLVRAHVAGEREKGGGAGTEDGGGGGAQEQQERKSGGEAEAAGAETAAAEAEAEGAALGSGPVTVSLRCPLHGGLAAAPAHFGSTAAAAPLAFFDLGAFLELAQRSGSWVCPASGRLGDLEDLRLHAFLSAVLRTLEHNGVRGRVEAIEVAPCGRWRPKDSRVPLLSVLDAEDAADTADPRVGQPRPTPPSFDPRLLDPEDDAGRDVVDLTDD